MPLTLLLVVWMFQPTPLPPQLRITSDRAQIGCEKVEQYESYHTSGHEKDGAVPQTKGCVRLMPKTRVTDLHEQAEARVMGGDKVPIELYETDVGGKKMQLWLSPSAVEQY